MGREAFWKNVRRGEGDVCWEWTGKRIRGGYGDFISTVGGKQKHTIAHRWAWTEEHGPIPVGLVVCHRCDNPACANPTHLFLGTQRDNEQDKIAKGRRAPGDGERNPNARLSVADVKEIRRLVNEHGARRAEVARLYALHPKTVSKIAVGDLWPEVPLDAPAAPPGRPGRPRKDGPAP